MRVFNEVVDLVIAWTLIVGAIVLMGIRPDIDATDIIIMAGAWTFGRGYSLVRIQLNNRR